MGARTVDGNVLGLTMESSSLSAPLPLCQSGQDQWGITNPLALSGSPVTGAGLPCLLI